MTFLIFVCAAFAEIAGSFTFWAWLRLNKSVLWLIPGTALLWIFSYLLTLVKHDHAGRVYAAYGAVYVCASIFWMWFIEGSTPDRYDLVGMIVCCAGTLIILIPRT